MEKEDERRRIEEKMQEEEAFNTIMLIDDFTKPWVGTPYNNAPNPFGPRSRPLGS